MLAESATANPDEILGGPGVLNRPNVRLAESALKGEITHHLGRETRAAENRNGGNSRNCMTGTPTR